MLILLTPKIYFNYMPKPQHTTMRKQPEREDPILRARIRNLPKQEVRQILEKRVAGLNIMRNNFMKKRELKRKLIASGAGSENPEFRAISKQIESIRYRARKRLAEVAELYRLLGRAGEFEAYFSDLLDGFY